MTRKKNRNYISAAAAAALLMGSASALSAIGEHDESRTDPAEAYEQQEAQRDRDMPRDGDAQRETTAQQDDWRDDQRQDERAQVDQERQVGTGEAAQQLAQLAQQHGNLSTFFKAVEEASMGDALVGTTQYTIFAPTDEAFEKHGRTDELLRSENREELISLLRAHIVADDVDPQMARSIGQARTIDGGTIDLRADDEQEERFQVGDASVVESDIQQNNLRIYAIDQVLSPTGELAAFEPGATDRDDADRQRDTEAQVRRDDDAQRDATAHQDESRDNEWQDEQAQVDDQERQAQVDPERRVGTGEAAQQLEQLAQQHGNLNTFFKAVQEAGLAEALVGTTQYTIFAPTDEAFEKHDRSADELLRPENREELISLLRAHIVADDVDPQMARSIGQARTIDGGTIDLRADEEQENRFQVGDASVVESDIQENNQQNNLRIYAIDQVLSPAGELAAFEPGATDRDDAGAQRTQRDAEMQRDTEIQRDGDLDRDTDWDTQRDSGTDTDSDWDTDTSDDTDW